MLRSVLKGLRSGEEYVGSDVQTSVDVNTLVRTSTRTCPVMINDHEFGCAAKTFTNIRERQAVPGGLCDLTLQKDCVRNGT
tara:strand:- start:31 stop:273 length:243 start_codon:yes stop_codon:yes gene_type:complete